MFNTILEDTSAELIEKKSKFIANVFYVESIEEAENKIKETRKKYYDARHNCFAYSIFSKNGIINRFSDDGEPSGTAGAPMLNILNSQNLCNVVVIVTRYFGGILLGTGGLVRAYTGALQKALENVNIVQRKLGLEVKIEVSYQDFEKAKYYFNQKNIRISDLKYLENAFITIEIPKDDLEELKNKELNFKIVNMKVIQDKYI